MIEVEVSKLVSPALDWAVIKTNGQDADEWLRLYLGETRALCIRRSISYADGCRYMEGDKIGVGYGVGVNSDLWEAGHTVPEETGSSFLQAAMRCFVSSRVGRVIMVPEELS